LRVQNGNLGLKRKIPTEFKSEAEVSGVRRKYEVRAKSTLVLVSALLLLAVSARAGLIDYGSADVFASWVKGGNQYRPEPHLWRSGWLDWNFFDHRISTGDRVLPGVSFPAGVANSGRERLLATPLLRSPLQMAWAPRLRAPLAWGRGTLDAHAGVYSLLRRRFF